jgi:hypothetical protein
MSIALEENSPQVQHHGAFRKGRCGYDRFAGALSDPVLCYPNALLGASLVLLDGH